jgi:putative endonuclease
MEKHLVYVYFLKLSNGDIYKGLTGDISRRLVEHHRGIVESTRNFRPVTLIGYEAYQLKSDAERREKFLKSTEGMRLLRLQYKDVLAEAQNCIAVVA